MILRWPLQAQPSCPYSRQEEREGQREKGENWDKSVLQRAFAEAPPSDFRLHIIGQNGVMRFPISKEAGKYVLGEHIAAPIDWDSVMNRRQWILGRQTAVSAIPTKQIC